MPRAGCRDEGTAARRVIVRGTDGITRLDLRLFDGRSAEALSLRAAGVPITSGSYTSGPFLQMHRALKPGSEHMESAWHFPIA